MTDSAVEQFVVMAKFGAPFGVRGWIKLYPSTEAVDGLADYDEWYVGNEGNWTTMKVEEMKPHKNGLVVKFKIFDTPEDVACLTNQLVTVPRSQLPELSDDDGYYWADIEQCEVFDATKQAVLGKVDYLYESEAYDVMVVKSSTGQECHVPFVEEDIVKSIDVDSKKIVIDWPFEE